MDYQLLKKILNTSSPSGFEKQLIEVLKEQLGRFCQMETDVMGNLYASSKNNNGIKIMLSAHCDEVGFQVTEIDENGYIYIRNVGGRDIHTVAGREVIILTNKKNICGVIGKTSSHIEVYSDNNQKLKISDLWVDIGGKSLSEVEKYITVGDYVVSKENFSLNFDKSKIISKALDDKIGVFILAETIKALNRMEIDASVTGVFTVQEELGGRGAMISTYKVKPDVAISVDVGIATDIPAMTTHLTGRLQLGDGPAICNNADTNYKLNNQIKQVAKDNNINYQNSVGYRPSGGTETTFIQLVGTGVATAHISIPNRYMHSSVEMCDVNDIENAISLIIKSIARLSKMKKSDFALF